MFKNMFSIDSSFCFMCIKLFLLKTFCTYDIFGYSILRGIVYVTMIWRQTMVPLLKGLVVEDQRMNSNKQKLSNARLPVAGPWFDHTRVGVEGVLENENKT